MNSGTSTNTFRGDHLVEYSCVIGYATPPSETVTLVSGINPSLTRTYIELANFYVSMIQTGAQWRIDGGAWRNAYDTAFYLPLGEHLVEFSDVIGYVAPAPITVNLVSGYSSIMQPTYVQLATLFVNFNQAPYAQWRIDGGDWHDAGDAEDDLTTGDHFVEFADVSGYITPDPVVVHLTGGYNSIFAPVYVEMEAVPTP